MGNDMHPSMYQALSAALEWRDSNRRQLNKNDMRVEVYASGKLIKVAFYHVDYNSNKETTSAFYWRNSKTTSPAGVHIYAAIRNHMTTFIKEVNSRGKDKVSQE